MTRLSFLFQRVSLHAGIGTLSPSAIYYYLQIFDLSIQPIARTDSQVNTKSSNKYRKDHHQHRQSPTDENVNSKGLVAIKPTNKVHPQSNSLKKECDSSCDYYRVHGPPWGETGTCMVEALPHTHHSCNPQELSHSCELEQRP